MIEFVFVGIPLIFMLISIFELARGMWIYNTLTHAVKEGTRYAIVRGSQGYKPSCQKTAPADVTVCQVDLQKIAQIINSAGAGLIPTDVTNMQFRANGTVQTCGGSSTLNDCLTSGAGVTWSDTDLGMGNTFAISAQYRFQSTIAMFWPGAGSGTQFGTFNLPASSQDAIQF